MIPHVYRLLTLPDHGLQGIVLETHDIVSGKTGVAFFIFCGSCF